MPVVLQHGAKAVIVMLGHGRATKTKRAKRLRRKLCDDAGIEAVGVLRLNEWQAVRRCTTRKRAALSLFSHGAGSEERIRAARSGPEQPRTHCPSFVTGNVRPAITVQIVLRLAVETSNRGYAPFIIDRRGDIAGEVLTIPMGDVAQDVGLKLVPGAL